MTILSRQTQALANSLSRGKAIQHTVDVGYYAPAARTTLNLAVFIVFLSEIELRLANPRVHTLWARAGAFRHPAVVCSTTTIIMYSGISNLVGFPLLGHLYWAIGHYFG